MANNNSGALIAELVGALQTALAPYAPSSLNTAPPTINTTANIDKMLGTNLNRSQASIYAELANIIDTAYKTAMDEQGDNERAFIQALANVADTAQDTMRNQYGEAASAGANRGMYAADVLSAILGMQNTSMDGVNTLFGNRSTLLNQRANDLAGAASEAQNAYNTLQQYLADYAKSIYETDSTNHTTELASWNAYIDAILGALPYYLSEYDTTSNTGEGSNVSVGVGEGGALGVPGFSNPAEWYTPFNALDKFKFAKFDKVFNRQGTKQETSALNTDPAIQGIVDTARNAALDTALALATKSQTKNNVHGGGSVRRGAPIQTPMAQPAAQKVTNVSQVASTLPNIALNNAMNRMVSTIKTNVPKPSTPTTGSVAANPAFNYFKNAVANAPTGATLPPTPNYTNLLASVLNSTKSKAKVTSGKNTVKPSAKSTGANKVTRVALK